jgi:hypothetical protein
MENHMSYLFNNEVGFIPTAKDAFARLRISEPFTLFDSSHRYRDNGLWSTGVTAGGTAAFNASGGFMELTVGTTSGSEVIRESDRVFPYQPGKSLLNINTFTMNPAKSGLRQRIGYFGASNGIFVEMDGATLAFVKRSSVSGSVTETKVTQDNWNIDPLNGSGPSGLSLDMSKSQIWWTDIEWLGAGTNRIGFIIDGNLIHCHSFHHANGITGTYFTTATLPIRYEITNTTAQASSSTLYQICSTVLSEGGYELRGTQQSISTPFATDYNLPVADTYYPVVAIRLKNTALDACVIFSALSIIPQTSGENYNYRILNGSGVGVSGGTWTSAGADSSIEYNLTGTSITGTGKVLASGYFSSKTNIGGVINLNKREVLNTQLSRNSLTNTPYQLILAITASQNNSKVFASIDWEEISR